MKVFLVSLGCDKNLVDSEHISGILQEAGYEFTDDESQADIIIINSCCFINDAKEESIETIFEMAKYKADKCKALVLAGCLAQRYHDEIKDEIPEIDICIGTTAFDDIANALEICADGHVSEAFQIKSIIKENKKMIYSHTF